MYTVQFFDYVLQNAFGDNDVTFGVELQALRFY